jgi:mannosyl-3-phosphoglycerate phosphatase
MRGFSDLSKEELFSLCGLSANEADFAKKREYDEAFVIEGEESQIEAVRRKIEEKGMHYAWGGRFHHILGNNDKGKAVAILKELYENPFFSITTLGIGDSANDYPMLAAVDHPFLLREQGSSLPKIPQRDSKWVIVEGAGPAVWNKVILSFLGYRSNGSEGDSRCG